MDDPAVDEATVHHIADLAHVEIDETAVSRFAVQFAEILEWFETLDGVPTIDEDEAAIDALRSDTIRPGLDHDTALENADDTEDGYFRGPPVG